MLTNIIIFGFSIGVSNFAFGLSKSSDRLGMSQSFSSRSPESRPAYSPAQGSADAVAVSPLRMGSFRLSRCLKSTHDGVDLPANQGTPIYAVKSGIVTHAGWIRGYGYTIVIDHGAGVQTLYAHQVQGAIEAAGTRRNQRVEQGQRIGAVGNTGNSFGNHLHFEVRQNGKFLNPTDEVPQILEDANGSAQCTPGSDYNQRNAGRTSPSGGRSTNIRSADQGGQR